MRCFPIFMLFNDFYSLLRAQCLFGMHDFLKSTLFLVSAPVQCFTLFRIQHINCDIGWLLSHIAITMYRQNVVFTEGWHEWLVRWREGIVGRYSAIKGLWLLLFIRWRFLRWLLFALAQQVLQPMLRVILFQPRSKLNKLMFHIFDRYRKDYQHVNHYIQASTGQNRPSYVIFSRFLRDIVGE